MKSIYKYYLIALGVIIFDQLTKVIVKTGMELGDEFSIIGDIVKIHFIENPGAAFGVTLRSFFSNMSADTAKVILTIFSVLAVFAIIYFLNRVATHKTRFPLFIALILGGAIGNIIDRVFYGVIFEASNHYEGGIFFGRVVDMIYFDIWNGQLPEWIPFIGGEYYAFWPIFNIADAAISVGIVAILIFQKKFFAPFNEPLNQGVTIEEENSEIETSRFNQSTAE